MRGAFDLATSLVPVEPGLWMASLDPTWAIGEAVHGGCAQALLARAALLESTHVHPVAMSAHFLAPTSPGIAHVDVKVLRSGRTASTIRASLIQDGAEKVVAHVTSATLGGATPDYEPRQPGMLEPEECMDRPPTLPDGSPVRFLDLIEVKVDPRHVGGPYRELSGVPEVRGWVRSRDGSPPDAVFLHFCVDALPPSVLEIGGQGWSPTVQMSSYVRAVPAPGWVQVISRAQAVSDGWFDEEAEVWDSAGRLVAQAHQLGRVRLGRLEEATPVADGQEASPPLR